MIVKMSHFVIEYTEPAVGERRWTKNCSADILTSTAERAIELLHEYNPDPTIIIHVVRRVGTNKLVLIDQGLL